MQDEFKACLIGATMSRDPTTLVTLVCQRLTSSSALTRIWLVDELGELRLAASAGTPLGGGSYASLTGAFRRVPRGAGKIGRIAESGVPLIARGLRGDEEWLENPGWIARQRVRSFVGLPLAAGQRTLGVLAMFDRLVPSDEWLADLRLVADVTAARLEALGDSAAETRQALPPPAAPLASPVLTRAQLRALEKQSIEHALRRTNGKVFGPDGAAALLGMKPTTLASRIKVLAVTRTRS